MHRHPPGDPGRASGSLLESTGTGVSIAVYLAAASAVSFAAGFLIRPGRPGLRVDPPGRQRPAN
ncbi:MULTISPECIES: hypothetical protein [Actinomycetes]|uniref:hypothetical protein n=1 Tax=Actinomycetes TaxID=1760 RepID=UPI0001B54B38|nr:MULTISPECIES: hypothetical protein [Actinomycetes]EFL08905.1 predicted protein [Streptomyces sp. AA4]